MTLRRIFPTLFGALGSAAAKSFGYINADQTPSVIGVRIMAEDGSLLAPEGPTAYHFLVERSDRLLTEAGDFLKTQNAP